MPWTVERLPELNVIETRYVGKLTNAELLAAASETLMTARLFACHRLLADCLQLEGGHSLADLFHLASRIEMENADLRLVREAVLLPRGKPSEGLVTFWKTTTDNRGIIVELFEDRNAALAWLCKH